MAISDDGNTILWHVSNLVWILKRCEESGCNHYVKTQLEIPALGNFRKKWRRSDLSKDGNAIGLLAENIDYSGQQILAYRLKQNGTIDGPPIVNKEWRDTAVDVCSHQVGKIMFSPDGKWLFGASLGNCTANIPSLFGFRVDNARDSFEEFPAYTGNAQVLDFDIRGNKIAYTVWGFGGGVGLFIRELP